jgi:hypothetical protein
MWIKKQFFDPFFFLSGPFQGGHFFGGIIYLAALDLRPATLNLRPAREFIFSVATTGCGG